MIVTINKLGRVIAVHMRWTEDQRSKEYPTKINYDVFLERIEILETIQDRVNFGLMNFIRHCRRNDILVILNLS